MKRAVTITVVLMLLLAATPAMAAKGGKPKPETGTFNVELTGVLDTGTCGTIPMSGHVPGTVRADLSTDVAVGMDLPIEWGRSYDAGWGVEGDAFTGCHGISASAVGTDSFGGYLILDVDADGTVTGVAMRFDYYWQFGVNPRNGRPVQEALELFELGFDGGAFTIERFTKDASVNGWTLIGSSAGTLTAEITATS